MEDGGRKHAPGRSPYHDWFETMRHDDQTPRSLERRTILRTAAHAAWAAPAISVVAAAPAFATSPDGSITDATVAVERVPTGDGIRTTLIRVTNDGPGLVPSGQLWLNFGDFSGTYDSDRIASQGPWVLQSVGSNVWFQYAVDLGPGTHTLPNVSAAWANVPPSVFMRVALHFDNSPVAQDFLYF